VFGTGKWANLIGLKLQSNGITPLFVGSNNADYTRDNLSHLLDCGCPIFIASSTTDHYKDLVKSISLNPSVIFVEKGFANCEQKQQAKSIVNNIPVYILSQYRYSEVFDYLLSLNDKINKCYYNWTIEKGKISEWAHHIISIDNYIKKTDNQLDITLPGKYVLDDISECYINFGEERSLRIDIVTDNYQFNILLGKTSNKIHADIENTTLEFNEDCLKNEIDDVLHNITNTKLERL
jgi:hypothetical protein